MKNKKENYDFDLIITNEELKANREKMLNNEKTRGKKRRLKRWVKVSLLLILGAIIGITIYQLFTLKTTYTTPVGDYTCSGGIIKVCSGSNAVANYLGV